MECEKTKGGGKMRDFVVKELDKFLEIADSLDTPFKFWEIKEKEIGRAWIWLRTALVSWEGVINDNIKLRLKEHGFSEAEERETKKITIEDLL